MSDNAAPASQVYGGNGFPHVGSPQYNGLSNPHGLGMVRPHGNCSDEQYLHYSQGGVRPGHPDGLSMSKGPRLLPPGRHGPGWGSMNCNPNQQRYMPPNMMGPSSEPGTTPTLNHLLQSSNSDQRYPGMPYNEYNMVSQKMNSEEMANQHGFIGHQQRQAMGSYQQSQQPHPMGIAGPQGPHSMPGQCGPGYDVNSRIPSMGNNRYPPQPSLMSGIHSLPQYSPNSQQSVNQPYGHMQQFSPNHMPSPQSSLPSHIQQPPARSSTPLSQHSDHSAQNVQKKTSSVSTSKSKDSKPKSKPKKQTKKGSKQENFNSAEEANVDSNNSNSSSGNTTRHINLARNGTPGPPPTPSPAGSVGSRSNTPASLSGNNMIGSPSMGQLDGQRILSPVHSQGGHQMQQQQQQQQHQQLQQQQIMPPPAMCPSHLGYPGSNKMPPSGGLSQQMPASFNNVYGNSGMPVGHSGMPGYNGSHPEPMNGPNHNPPHPSMNRMPPYPGMDNKDVERQYGSGHGMPPGGGNTGRAMGAEGMNGRLEDPAFPRRPPMDQPSPHHMPMEQSMHGRPMGDGRMMPGDNRHDFGMPQSMYHCYSPAQMAGFGKAYMNHQRDGSMPGMPGSGMPGPGMPAQGMPGQGMPGSGMPGPGMPGAGMAGPGMPGSTMSGSGAFPCNDSPALPGMEPRLPPGMDPRLPPGMETRMPPGMEPRMPPGMETRMPPGMEPCMPPGMENRMPPGMEPRLPPGMESRLPPGMEPRMPPGMEPRMPPGMEPRMPPGMESRLPPGMEPRLPPDGDSFTQTKFDANNAQRSDIGEFPQKRSYDLMAMERNIPVGMPDAARSPGPAALKSVNPSSTGSLEAADPSAPKSTGFTIDKNKWLGGDGENRRAADGEPAKSEMERENSRTFDEGNTSDTQSSDIGTASQLTEESATSSMTGNSVADSVLNSSADDHGNGKPLSAPKKSRSENSFPHFSMSSHVAPSPLTMVSEEADNCSNASCPNTPKCGGQNEVLNRLAEMGDEPDRRQFLERLFAFMEEKGTPITAVPMISKQPVDLYKLYCMVKEYGGMVEVTKNKKWRDVSSALSMGPSSSAGFTLKKNYGKHVFSFECYFDRGNVDPVPILAFLEQPTKKESKKAAAERAAAAAAAAAAANAQDMYRMPPGQQFGPYPGGSGIDPNNQMMMPPHQQGQYPSMSNMMPGGMTGAGTNRLPPPPGNSDDTINIQNPFSDIPNQRSMSGGPAGFHLQQSQQPGFGNNYQGADGRPPNMPYPPLEGAAGGSAHPELLDTSTQSSVKSEGSAYGGNSQEACGNTFPNRLMSENANDARQMAPPAYGPHQRFDSSCMPPPAMSIPPAGSQMDPRSPPEQSFYNRFPSQHRQTADQQGPYGFGGYPGQPRMRPPMGDKYYPGPMGAPMPDGSAQPFSSNNVPGPNQPGFAGNEFLSPPQRPVSRSFPESREGFGSPFGVPPFYGEAGPRAMYPPGGPQPLPAGGGMVDKQFPPNASSPVPPYRADNMEMRRDWATPGYHPSNYQPSALPYGGAPVDMAGGHHQRMFGPSGQPNLSPHRMDRQFFLAQEKKPMPMLQAQREISFPPDSVEATQPRAIKRKKYTHKHLGPVDPWRVMMALKSGLIGESTWALDVLSILLHDDATFSCFGLQHMPGLVEILMEHFRCCLVQIFENKFDDLEQMIKPAGTSSRISDREASSLLDEVKKLSSGENAFPSKTRNNAWVEVEENESEAAYLLDSKTWDVFDDPDSSFLDWQMGHSDISFHIQTNFHLDESLKFYRNRFFGKHRNSTEQVGCDELSKRVININSNEAVVDLKKPLDILTVPTKELLQIKNKCESIDSVPSANNVDNLDASTDKMDIDGLDEDAVKTELQLDENGTVSESNSSSSGCIHKVCHQTFYNVENGRTLESLKREWMESSEEVEAFQPIHRSLLMSTDSKTEVSRRCLCISNILRGLSFLPGNDSEMSRHSGLLLVLGRVLLLNHDHLKPKREMAKVTDNDTSMSDGEQIEEAMIESYERCSWEVLEVLREDTFVILANICGQLDLSVYAEEICMPILNGLLHWMTCTAACTQDPLPTMPAHLALSPKRLILEALSKLCITDCNVDLLLAMPPYSRIVQLLSTLVQLLAESGDQVVREFTIVLILSLMQGDSSTARAVALHHTSISILLDFIETADHQALKVVNVQGHAALKESPEMMGTSMDMLRRAAAILRCMAEVPENKPLFARYHQRLLQLVMSQVLDTKVSATLGEVIYYCSS